MSIWCNNTKNMWHSKLYDQHVALMKKGLKHNRFPHPQSKLATQCNLGVITSQLHRYNIACTQPKDFLSAATSLYTAYIEKGYQTKLVNRYFEKFRRRHTPHFAHVVPSDVTKKSNDVARVTHMVLPLSS